MKKSIKLAGLLCFNDYRQNSRTKGILTAVCLVFLALRYCKLKKTTKDDKSKVIKSHFYYRTASNAHPALNKSPNTPTTVNALRVLVRFVGIFSLSAGSSIGGGNADVLLLIYPAFFHLSHYSPPCTTRVFQVLSLNLFFL